MSRTEPQGCNYGDAVLLLLFLCVDIRESERDDIGPTHGRGVGSHSKEQQDGCTRTGEVSA